VGVLDYGGAWQITSFDAAMRILFHIEDHWRGTSEFFAFGPMSAVKRVARRVSPPDYQGRMTRKYCARRLGWMTLV
jgi:hypothetical protein